MLIYYLKGTTQGGLGRVKGLGESARLFATSARIKILGSGYRETMGNVCCNRGAHSFTL